MSYDYDYGYESLDAHQRLLPLSNFEKIKASCSGCKVVVAIAIIVALALAITGALALVGIHYPDTALASLGHSIGLGGSIAMVASGTAGAVLIKFIDWAHTRRNKFQYEHIS